MKRAAKKPPAKKKPVAKRAKVSAAEHSHIREILSILKKTYPDADCALVHKNPLELLVATILSAQCTDARVNIVTKNLFKKYKKAKDYATAPPEELEQDIRSTGFYRQKTKSIQAVCSEIGETHGGTVPKSMEALSAMRGVGRKTANVVLGNAFGVPSGVVVDTHVKRLSYRMGLTTQTDPNKVELDLMEKIPEREWILFAHRMIHHGRQICNARKPKCDICPLEDTCPQKGVG